MPKIKIGMRIIKTFIAVFLCFLIDYFRRGSIPFYSIIAAVLCMQKDIQSSKNVSINRMIGTIIGGIYGLVILLLFKYILYNISRFAEYCIDSLAVIPLIYFTVQIKRPASSYISCVVFFSIVVSHKEAGDNPYLFALHRIIDTSIGILVSLFINWIPILNKNSKDD